MSEDAFGKEGIYIYLPLAVAMLFGVACGLGFLWRKSPQVHARFMVSTALLLIDPVLARVMYFYLPRLTSENMYQGITFSLIAVAMAALVWSLPAFVKGRTWYRNYCICAIGTLVLFFTVPHTSPWLVFVKWFREAPLT